MKDRPGIRPYLKRCEAVLRLDDPCGLREDLARLSLVIAAGPGCARSSGQAGLPGEGWEAVGP